MLSLLLGEFLSDPRLYALYPRLPLSPLRISDANEPSPLPLDSLTLIPNDEVAGPSLLPLITLETVSTALFMPLLTLAYTSLYFSTTLFQLNSD